MHHPAYDLNDHQKRSLILPVQHMSSMHYPLDLPGILLTFLSCFLPFHRELRDFKITGKRQ